MFDGERYLVLVAVDGFAWTFPVIGDAVPAEATKTGCSVSMEEVQALVALYKTGEASP